MEKKINKKKIVKFAASGLLCTALTIGAGISVCDAQIDHYNELCPLNNVWGVEHQIWKINNDNDFTTNASLLKDGIIEDTVPAARIYTVPDGYSLAFDVKTGLSFYTKEVDGEIVDKILAEPIISVPSGYILEGTIGIKQTKVTDGDAIMITRDYYNYPEGSEPGDIVKKSDLELVGTNIEKYIEIKTGKVIEAVSPQFDKSVELPFGLLEGGNICHINGRLMYKIYDAQNNTYKIYDVQDYFKSQDVQEILSRSK